MASLIRTFVAAGGRPRASGVEAQRDTTAQLQYVARASVADSRAIVSAEGLLRRMERNLTAATSGADGGLKQDLAYASLAVLDEAMRCNVDTSRARVAEEHGLLRALMLFVA